MNDNYTHMAKLVKNKVPLPNMRNLCAILNISPLYRKAIYSAMDCELDCDFYFGDISNENIALMNPGHLKGFRSMLVNVYRGSKLVWQRGALRAAFSRGGYRNYILTGNAGIKSNWIIALLARLLGRKVWLWTHGLRGNESRFSRFVNILYMHLASGMMFYSTRGAELALSAGIPSRKLHVIYNSLDYTGQRNLRSKVGDTSFLRNYFGNDDPYVIFVGRLTKQKKVEQILHAMKGIQCNLLIVGDGKQGAQLEKLSEELGMQDRVWFYGECYDEQMLAQMIYHATLFVSPGNIGLSAIHSMTYGTVPVTNSDLCFQMPEVESVIELSKSLGTQLLFLRDDIQSISAIICTLLPIITADREAIREKCYSVIEGHWNVSYQISLMKSLFGM